MLLSIILTIILLVSSLFVSISIKDNEEISNNVHFKNYTSYLKIFPYLLKTLKDVKHIIVRIRNKLRIISREHILHY